MLHVTTWYLLQRLIQKGLWLCSLSSHNMVLAPEVSDSLLCSLSSHNMVLAPEVSDSLLTLLSCHNMVPCDRGLWQPAVFTVMSQPGALLQRSVTACCHYCHVTTWCLAPEVCDSLLSLLSCHNLVPCSRGLWQPAVFTVMSQPGALLQRSLTACCLYPHVNRIQVTPPHLSSLHKSAVSFMPVISQKGFVDFAHCFQHC